MIMEKIENAIENACVRSYIKGYSKGQEDLSKSVKEKIEAYAENHSYWIRKEEIFKIIDELVR